MTLVFTSVFHQGVCIALGKYFCHWTTWTGTGKVWTLVSETSPVITELITFPYPHRSSLIRPLPSSSPSRPVSPSLSHPLSPAVPQCLSQASSPAILSHRGLCYFSLFSFSVYPPPFAPSSSPFPRLPLSVPLHHLPGNDRGGQVESRPSLLPVCVCLSVGFTHTHTQMVDRGPCRPACLSADGVLLLLLSALSHTWLARQTHTRAHTRICIHFHIGHMGLSTETSHLLFQ